VSLIESVANTAAAAILNPLAQELALYLAGKTTKQPAWVTSLPAVLRSRVSLEAKKARTELLSKGSVPK
jgi:hypothetical protein